MSCQFVVTIYTTYIKNESPYSVPFPKMNSARAEDALRLLGEIAAEREHELSNYPTTREQESDTEADEESPIFNSFYNSGGSESIMKMTNFTPNEFRTFYGTLQSHIMTKWNVGRGKRSQYKPMDVFFMSLVTMKYGGSWDQLGNLFRIKGPTYMKLIVGFLEKLRDFMVERFVTKFEKQCSINYLNESEQLFEHFPFALEALDVTFQQSNRPSGNMQEGKVYYSGKHKLYGYKVEVCVRPNGLASAFSSHFPGSVSDLTILHKRHTIHQKRLKKRDDDGHFKDEYAMAEKYPNHWAILADKGYQSASEILRAVTPRKKPARGVLGREDEWFNKKLSSDRILVENYFGRMGQLWSVLSRKFVWSEKLFDLLFAIGVAATNYHVTIHKLRDDDSEWYNRYKNRLLHVGVMTKRKRAESQAKYRKKRKVRLQIGYRAANVATDDETQQND